MRRGMGMIVDQLNLFKAISEFDSIDYILSAYMLDHWKEVCTDKMTVLVEKTGISKSTLARFCKKLGYRSFTEVQYALYYEMNVSSKMTFSKNCLVLDSTLKKTLKTKKRIIVLGAVSPLAVLLNYVPFFKEAQCELILKLKGGSIIDFMTQNQVNQDDLIVYVSLHKSNLELQVDYLGLYNDLTFWVYSHQIDFLYIGKMAVRHDMTSAFIPIKTELLSDCLCQLSLVFESILSYLYQRDS